MASEEEELDAAAEAEHEDNWPHMKVSAARDEVIRAAREWAALKHGEDVRKGVEACSALADAVRRLDELEGR